MPEYDIFISYASEERDWVREHLYEPLLRCRKPDGKPPRVFFDAGELTIEVGLEFMDALVRAIYTSQYVVPVYSDIYFSKGMCNWELGRSHEFSISRGHPQLVPVLKDPEAMDRVPLKVNNIEYLSSEGRGWFLRLCNRLGLVMTPERAAVLEFLDQPPPQITVNHTLPPLRIQIRRTPIIAVADEEITVTAESGELNGTLSVKAEKGISTFNDLSFGSATTGACLNASAKGIGSVRSSITSVVDPSPINDVSTRSPLLQARGEAIFFLNGQSVAVIETNNISVFDRQGSSLGEKCPIASRLRLVRRSGRMIVLADWTGNITAVCDDGALRQWFFESETNGMHVPGSIAIDNEDIYVGFWSGDLYRLALKGEPVRILTHEAGIQALAVGRGMIFIAGLDGTLILHQEAGSTMDFRIEPIVHFLKLYSNCLVAVGDTQLFHLGLDSKRLYDERLPFESVSAVLGDSDFPVVMNNQGRGLRFDSELVSRLRFRIKPGARPISSDNEGLICIFLNPDGSHSLMRDDQVVFTHYGCALAVSPDGSQFALGKEKGIQIIDRSTFYGLVRGT